MAKALYRKHRSRSLAEVVGQNHITDVLQKSLDSHNISHAYLFIGPRGTGKTSVARILAHAVNDFPYEIEDTYLDIIEIDAASNTGVDNIRDLKEKALIAPSKGKYKVYIIDEVHMLSKSAFNALLKLLEEPPTHVIFIMATTDAYKIPVTITSRSQVFTFKLAEHDTMLSHLKTITAAEHIPITDEALEIIVSRGGGSFRDSLSLLDQISTLSQSPDTIITQEMVVSALGLPTTELLQTLLTSYQTADLPTITKNLKSLLETGVRPEIVAEELIKIIVDRADPPLIPLLSRLIDVSRHQFPLAKLLLALTSINTPVSRPVNVATNSPHPPIISQSTEKVNTYPVKPSSANTTNTINPALSSTTNPVTNTPESHHPTHTYDEFVKSSKHSPTPPAKNTPETTFTQPALQAAVTIDTFNWDTFLLNVGSANRMLVPQLKLSQHELVGNTLKIIPKNKISQKILDSPRNKEIFLKYLGDLNLDILDPDATANSEANIDTISTATTDPLNQTTSTPPSPLDQLSAIMGSTKELKTNGDDIPF